jgi:putative transcriptional regulator
MNGATAMEKTLLNKLMQSLKEAKAISQGRLKPSRRFLVSPSDVKAAYNVIALRSARGRARF